jgi:filamentous hemagglutinin family protein
MSRFSHSLLLATTALASLSAGHALANPLGAQVVGGSATVQGQGTAAVTVRQQTNSAIIDWRQFNIGVGESTAFVQPSASSVILNRVTGDTGPSEILGSLTANGKVFLVNPDGVLFGAGAAINAGSFLATTSDIANSDFMAGRYNFRIPGQPSASIVNEGSITARSGGFAALVAPGVRNDGTITATLGTIGLAAGNGFTLDFYGDKLITLGVSDSIAAQVVDVATGQPLDTLVKNAGALEADGGRVELSASAARQVVDSVINNTGLIEADTIGSRNGKIVLSAATANSKLAAAPTQVVKVSGKLSAAGKKEGTKGGTIVVTGKLVKLASATLDASGAAGGGKVLVGGDTGGGSPSPATRNISEAALEAFAVPTAANVSVDAGSTINVSAIVSGNGGKAVVWADETTSVAGTILARGGAKAGDGGFIETSGRLSLGFIGRVDVGAIAGVPGAWLLDPKDVTIGVTGPWVITPQSIETALLDGNVIVTTDQAGTNAGDISVAQSVHWNSGYSLTLNANRNIVVDGGATIANAGAGDLTLRADSGGAGVGTVNFLGTGKVDFSQSTGLVSIFYNPADNPAGSAVNNTNYTNPTDYAPYVITNGAAPNQLNAYMLVNSIYDIQNIENNMGGSYALGRNISGKSDETFNPIGNLGWVTIGSPSFLSPEASAFTGVFDGQGYTISDLTITTDGGFVGLFAANSGAIRNVGLTHFTIGTTEGVDVGGLVGVNYGTISNSSVSGSITGTNGNISSHFSFPDGVGGLVGINFSSGSISNSYSTGSVTSGNTYNVSVGGLVGVNLGTVFQSHADGLVVGFNNLDSAYIPNVGGLVGSNGLYYESLGTIAQSYADGTVTGGANSNVGGLAGSNDALIRDSYATAAVTGGGSVQLPNGDYAQDSTSGFVAQGGSSQLIQNSYAVGAVGLKPGSPTTWTALTFGLVGPGNAGVADSYWDTESTGQSAGGYRIAGIGMTTSELKSGLPAGFNPTVWAINASVNNGYPYLLWQTAAIGPTTIITLSGDHGNVLPVSPIPIYTPPATPAFPNDDASSKEIIRIVTEDDMRSESRTLLHRLFAQANTSYNLYDAVSLLIDISTLAGSFDSKYHSPAYDQELMNFRGRILTGSDLNYYFEGVLFSAYGWPEVTLYAAMRIWKLRYGAQPSSDAFWAAEQGYKDGAVSQYIQ